MLKAALEPLTLLRLDIQPRDARVLLDGREVVGLKVEVEPGVVQQLRVEAPGYKAHEEELVLEPGEQREVLLELDKRGFFFR